MNCRQLIIVMIASAVSAARLDNVYLPANAASSGGANAGLLTPLSGNQGAQSNAGPAQPSNAAQAQILRLENEINEEGYHYAYETSDGTKAEQNGECVLTDSYVG